VTGQIVFSDRNVVMRIVKPYPGARNHIYTGRIVGYDGNFVAFDGCVLNYGRASSDDPGGGLTVSQRALRWVALQRVEYIRELPDGMNPFDPASLEVSADGSIVYPAVDRPDLLPD
jgi:hypothetical protein